MKPLVYIAGPITTPNPMHNTHETLRIAAEILDRGLVLPFVPHLTVLWDIVVPRPYEEWMGYDFGVIEHCNALLRLSGESLGADREVEHAAHLNIPTFFNHHDLYAWVLCVWPER